MVRVAGFALSLDGFGAGLDQGLETPLGRRGAELFPWFFQTQAFCDMRSSGVGETGVDHDFAFRGMDGFGAFIIGRNMFGPIRGDWGDRAWRGWWGETPPFHAPVFVLTHHPRESLVMDGGTTFYFVDGGIHDALAKARAVAGDKDVKIGGGVSTVRQYLAAGLIDELHFGLSPVVLGRGEAVFAGLDLTALGFAVTGRVEGERATHFTLTRQNA